MITEEQIPVPCCNPPKELLDRAADQFARLGWRPKIELCEYHLGVRREFQAARLKRQVASGQVPA